MDSAFTAPLLVFRIVPGEQGLASEVTADPSAGAHEDELTEAFGRRAGPRPGVATAHRDGEGAQQGARRGSFLEALGACGGHWSNCLILLAQVP